MVWHKPFVQKYGAEEVEDDFAGTPFGDKAAQIGFGLYIIRDCLPADHSADFHVQLKQAFLDVALGKGTRAVQVKGTKLWYEALQVLLGKCICEYRYAASAKTKVRQASDVPVLGGLSKWLHNCHHCDDKHRFHQIVSNIYSFARDDSVPWHTDANKLLAQSTDVIALSLGASGIFCYQPRPDHLCKE